MTSTRSGPDRSKKRCAGGGTAVISGRTGFPVTRPFSPARRAASPSKPHNTPDASGFSNVVDINGAASAFSRTTGTPSVLAAMPAGTAT